MAAESKTGCFLNFPKNLYPARPPPMGGLFAVRTTHTVKLKMNKIYTWNEMILG